MDGWFEQKPVIPVAMLSLKVKVKYRCLFSEHDWRDYPTFDDRAESSNQVQRFSQKNCHLQTQAGCSGIYFSGAIKDKESYGD